MKPKKLDKKLTLNKETITDIGKDEMNAIWGMKDQIPPSYLYRESECPFGCPPTVITCGPPYAVCNEF
jgi:hypothetical protein